jgi:probable F420-dependent oxidoreductase
VAADGTSERQFAVNLMGIDELYGGSFRGVLEAAGVADDLGADMVVLPDHLTLHRKAHRERDGFPYPIDVNWYEPVVALSAIAAATRRIRLGTNVLVAPLRPALVLAKQLATLDVISGGRLELGLGVGWQVEEFAAAGMPFDGRFGTIVEQVEAFRALWSGGPSHYEGRRIGFDDLYSLPVPVQGKDIPISLGLSLTPRMVERIVRLRVGWAPRRRVEPEALRAGIAQLREECVRVGRDPASLRVTGAVPMPPHRTSAAEFGAAHPLDQVQSFWEAGADVVVVHPRAFCRRPDDLPKFLQPLLEARAA